ncbi:MFS transporter, partial [Rhizobium johnstonii]|uniref:MFS transporter n=1 Tax=Rhizobium johnstonii TaxID=3019933 RepID=UPI003F9D3182
KTASQETVAIRTPRRPILPAKNRGRWLVLLEGFWAVGTLVVALAAWLLSLWNVAEAWRLIFAVTALPAIIGFGLRFFVPE